MYNFIIDTDTYAGNFEREMCAYLTGQIGDCGVGKEFRQKFLDDKIQINFDNIIHKNDEGCYRPVEICPNPNWFNDGMGSHWKVTDNDLEKQLKTYAKSIEDYETRYIKQKKEIIKELENGRKVSDWTIEAAEKEIKQQLKIIEDAKNLKEINKHLAYNSVAIHFDTKPTEKQIELMKNRSYKFCDIKKSMKDYLKLSIKIENFRLIKIQQTETEETI